MSPKRATRSASLLVLTAMVLSALALVALPASPAAADHLPPPGNPAVASGTAEGTELLEDQTLSGACFTVRRHIFEWGAQGTIAGKTAGGDDVVYRALLGAGQETSEGPLRFKVDAVGPYYHGPGGTHGMTDNTCSSATVGSPITGVSFSVFAAGNVYKLDGGGAQVPCTGTGSFVRSGADWHAQWTLSADCTVVGNAAGTPGTGIAKAQTVFTHEGIHDPCFSVCNSNFRLDYSEHFPVEGLFASLTGPETIAVNRNAAMTAVVEYDGAPLAGASVAFSVAGPGTATPSSGTVMTGGTGQAPFSFTSAVEGDYVVTATVTSPAHPGEEKTVTFTVSFSGPQPRLILHGVEKSPNGDPVLTQAELVDDSDPIANGQPSDWVPNVPVSFSVSGPSNGQASPASGSDATDTVGTADFTFTANRAGSYVVTATATYAGQTVSATRTVDFEVDSFTQLGTLSLGSNSVAGSVRDAAGNFLYIGTSSTTSARILKIDLNTFAVVGEIPVSAANKEWNLTVAAIDPAGQYAYFGSGRNTSQDTEPGRIIKVDLTTFQRVATLTLAPGDTRLSGGNIDPAGDFLYVNSAAAGSLGKMIKIDLDTFQRVGDFTIPELPSGFSMYIHPSAEYAIFSGQSAFNGAGPAYVFKYDLATMERLDTLQLDPAEERRLGGAVFDPEWRYATYFVSNGNLPSNAWILRIDLSTLDKVAKAPVPNVGAFIVPSLSSPTIDRTGKHAYLTASSPWAGVVKVDLATLKTVHIPTSAPLGRPLFDPQEDYAFYAGGSSVVKVQLFRTPNPALTAGNDSHATAYRTPLTVAAPGVLANDVDTVDADPLFALDATTPPGGTVTMGADGSFTYTPKAGFTGTETFTYQASDGIDVSPPATVSVAVAAAPEGVRGVEGGACGYYTNVSLFGAVPEVRGCGQAESTPATTEQIEGRSPSVTLPLTGSAGLTATDTDGATGRYGPAAIFSGIWPDTAPGAPPSGPLTVSTQGTTGPGGSTSSSASIVLHPGAPPDAPGGIGPGPVVADEAHSTCAADESGLSGSASFVNGVVETRYDAETQLPLESVDIPANPPANFTVEGTLDHVGDSYRVVLNEQILGPDSITVNAVHMYLLGPTAVGEMVIAQSRCAVDVGASNAAPTAANDAFTTGAGDTLTVPAAGVLANDTDPDGHPLRASTLAPNSPPAAGGGEWTFFSDPDHGSVSLNIDGSFTYTPDGAYVGPDSFTYQAQDSRGRSSPKATVNITVEPNLVALDDSYTTAEDTPLTVAAPGVLANDAGSPLSAVMLSDPAHGTATLNGDGSFTYTPALNYFGPDSFTYRANDGSAASDVATVTLTVTPVNEAPVANDDTYATTAGTGLSIAAPGVLANDTDIENDTLTAGSATAAAHGIVSLVANGSFTYIPEEGFVGTDTFTYVASDATLSSAPATVTITVTAVPEPVTSLAAQMLVDINPGTADGSVSGGLLFNGERYFSATTAATGSELWKTDGTAAGTVLVADIFPGPGGSGPQNFVIYNGELFFNGNGELMKTDGTTAGTVLVKKIHPQDGFASSPTNFAIFNGILYFRAGTGSTAPGANGTELWKTDGTTDGTVLVKDINVGTGNSNPANLTVFNGALLFTASNGTTAGQTPAQVGTELWKTDGTADGTVLVKDINAGTGNSSPSNLTISNGTVLFSASNGTTTGLNGVELWKTDGTTTGTVQVKDINSGTASSSPGNFTVLNNTVLFSATNGTTVGVGNGTELWKTDGTNAGTVLVKDINVGTGNSTPATFAVLNNTVIFRASNGTTAGQTPAQVGSELWKTDGTTDGTVMVKDINPGTANSSPNGMTTVDGTLYFFATAPNVGTEPWTSDGTEAGTLMVADIDPGTASSFPGNFASVGGSVLFSASNAPNGDELWRARVNTSPRAFGDSYSTAEDTVLAPSAPGVLANDTDPDSDPLSAVVVSPPAHGVLALNADGSFSYTPEANYNGPDFFTYKLRDGFVGPNGTFESNVATVPITVTPATEAPTAVDDTYSTDEDSPLTVNAPGVLANDTDDDGDTLTAGSASDPANGSVTLNADGSFTYTPDAEFSGSDTFTYTVSDGQGGTDEGLVSITVNSVNDAPAAVDDAYSTSAGVPLTVTAPGVLANDSDSDGGTLSAGATSDPAHGSVALAADGSFTYTTDLAGFSGTDSFVYETFDGQGGIDTATVTITITPDPAPTTLAVNDISVTEGSAGTTPATFTLTRSGNASGASTVKVKTSGGTATAGVDYTAVPLTTVSFAAFETTKTVTVDVAADTFFEANETFNLALSAATGASISDGSGKATIVNDDAAPSLSVDDTSVAEGDGGTTPATFTVTRSGNTSGSSTVKVKTAGGNASAGVDYVAVGLTTLSFAPGETTKTVPVAVVGDTSPEGDETFNLMLSAATGAVIADNSGKATIVNDDAPAFLSVDDRVVHEGDAGTTAVSFTITRSGNLTGSSTVKYRTSGGTATAGVDYAAVGLTSVTFAPGETTKTVTVDVFGDTAVEPIETFNLALSAATGASISDATGRGTIVNDD